MPNYHYTPANSVSMVEIQPKIGVAYFVMSENENRTK